MTPRRLFRVKLDLKSQSWVSSTEDQTERKKPSERRSEAGCCTSLTPGTMCDCYFACDGTASYSILLSVFFAFLYSSVLNSILVQYLLLFFVLCETKTKYFSFWTSDRIRQNYLFEKINFGLGFLKHQILHKKYFIYILICPTHCVRRPQLHYIITLFMDWGERREERKGDAHFQVHNFILGYY